MDDEIYLTDILAPLLAKWKLLVVVTLICATLGFVKAKMTPRVYESTATIFIQGSSAAAGLRAGLPLAFGPMTGGSVGYYTTLLQSDTLRQRTIARLDLLHDRAFTKGARVSPRAAGRKLKSLVLMKDNKNGGIDISVRSADPRLSARVANGVLDSLSEMVITGSKRKVEFIGRRLVETTKALDQAEARLLAFQKRVGVPMVEEETKRVIEQLGKLDTELLTLEVDLLETKSALGNAGDLDLLVQHEIRKRALQSGLDYVLQKRDEALAGLERLPEIASAYVKLQRDVTVLSKTFELLTERYQLAKIDQQGEGGDYQVIDKAKPSDMPLARGTIAKTVTGGVGGFVLASIIVLTVALTRRRRKPSK